MENGSKKNGSSKSAPRSEPLTGEQQRTLCFNLFNQYWEDAAKQGVDFDVVGTMSISAALFGIVAKHGKGSTIDFMGNLAKSVAASEFDFQEP
jgi:hypothetical protein